MSNFPISLDDSLSLPNPAANNKQNNPSHSFIHSTSNDALKAVESKVGIGASTPTNNKFLKGTGVGTSEWFDITAIDQDGTLKAGAVDNAACLATDVVETAKIKDGQITNAKLADGSITWDKLDDTAVVTVLTGTSSGISLTPGTTQYIGQSEVSNNKYLMPIAVAGELSDLTFYATGSPGLDKHYTATMMVDNIASALTCDIGYGCSNATDYTHTVSFDANKRICLRVVTTDGAVPMPISWSAKFIPRH